MTISAHKDLARAYFHACDTGGDLSPFVADTIIWDGPRPVMPVTTPGDLQQAWLDPFRSAFPEMRRDYHILMAGVSSGRVDGGVDGRDWVGATGYLVGTARHDVFGIPATDAPLRLRWGEFLRIEDGKIVEIQMLIDMMDWFEQIGRPVLPPSLGAPKVWPAPTAFDGVQNETFSSQDTDKTVQLGRELLFGGLNTFDESDLTSMGIARFFHPNIKWYGPGGIGACLSLDEFEAFHQQPWLSAFPDRKVQDLPSLFAEGRLLGASGPKGVTGSHSGGSFRGSHAGDGKPIDFCGLDFWLRTDDLFTENWVFVDFIHLFEQMGIDLMDKMQSQ